MWCGVGAGQVAGGDRRRAGEPVSPLHQHVPPLSPDFHARASETGQKWPVAGRVATSLWQQVESGLKARLDGLA